MDYKKEYEAMVHRARELHEAGNFLTKKQMEIVCPELAESEDERIRKEMIKAISEIEPDKTYLRLSQEEKDAWIAYLEKQKEEEGYEAIPVESTLEYKLGFKAGKDSEKQKEQKPTDGKEYSSPECGTTAGVWSEEDKIKLDNCCAVIAQQETYFDTLLRQKCLDFLYELPKRFALSPKVEWSEEDELMIITIIQTLEMLGGRGTTGMQIDWLKALRPSWKPTEEQMEALKNSAYGAYQNGDGPALRELYEHLKKL